MQNQYFYGHGKLLLSGEYFVLEGAKALALPTSVGQSMKVKYRQSYQPTLEWKSVDHTGKTWFESNFEFWHFRPIKASGSVTEKFVSDTLRAVRLQNPHFLRDDMDVSVETKIEFPLDWGLGSSSSLIYNVAQWAYVSPFELLSKTIGGSGYDIACAQAFGPIKYQLHDRKPQWEATTFNPIFKNNISFLYLGNKQNSASEVVRFKDLKIEGLSQIVSEISQLTNDMIRASDLETFSRIMLEHEKIISLTIKKPRVKDLHFKDFWGEIKSLGAWGGDFAMVTSDRSFLETRKYFELKGFSTLIPFSEMIFSDHK